MIPPTNELSAYLLANEEQILTDFQKFVDAHPDEKADVIGQVLFDCSNLAKVQPTAIILWLAKHHPKWLHDFTERIPEKAFPNQLAVIANILRKVQF